MLFFHNFFKKRKWFLIGAVLLLIIGGYFMIRSSDDTQQATGTKTLTVQKGTIQETIKVVGTAELVNEQKLRFNQTGKVVSVYFSDGKSVKQGDVIAELDKSNYDNDMKQAQVSLNNSQITLRNLLEGNEKSQIDKAKTSVSETERSIDTAKKDLAIQKQKYNQTITDLNKELTLAKQDRDNTQQSLEASRKKLTSTSASEKQNVSSTETKYASTLENTFLGIGTDFVNVKDLLSSINNFLGVEGQEEQLNDAYENLISALNSQYRNKAETSYRNTKNKLTAAESQYNTMKTKNPLSKEDVLSALESTKSILESGIESADLFYNVAANTVSGTNLSQTEIDSQKNTASSAIKDMRNKLDALQTNIATIKNLEDSGVTQLASESTLVQAQNSVKDAELNLAKAEQNVQKLQDSFASDKESANLTVVKAENDLKKLESDLENQKQDLKELEDGMDTDDIAKARNDITQKELALEKARSNVDNYQIIAPFDGVVRKIDYKPGDKILQDDEKFVYIENPNLMKIDITLDQIDIVKTEVGQKAKIVFDAFPDKTFDGVIEEVDQTPQTTSGVVSYTVSLTLNKGDAKIYSGMTASVTIITKEAKDVLVVPTIAVSSRRGKNIVRKQVDGNITPIEVETGMSDGQNTEIIKGLNEGDTILEQEFVIPQGSASTQQQRMGLGGGLGGLGGGGFGGGGNRSGGSGNTGRSGSTAQGGR